MENLNKKHSWKENLKIVDRDYLIAKGVNLENVTDEVLSIIEATSKKAIEDYAKLDGKPPLLKFNQTLPVEFVPIPEDLVLEKHCTSSKCPTYIREVVPCAQGCQLNCQYCCYISSTQTHVSIYENYAEWFKKQLSENRVENKNQRGKLYYWSAKTEALSPEMVELGIAQDILRVFQEHVREEEARLGGCCPDTLLIITKAGKQELFTKGPNGDTILELMKNIPNNLQVCGSVNYLNDNLKLREALEPGARSEKDRFEMLKILQENNIQASGILLQPILPPFIPDDNYFKMLNEKYGIKRMHVDVLTSNVDSLSVVIQIIGWFYPEAEKMMWDLYLPQDAPSKAGGRRGFQVKTQRAIMENIMSSGKKAGMSDFTYCRFTEKILDLPPRMEEECMCFITPNPENIEKSRYEQTFSSNESNLATNTII